MNNEPRYVSENDTTEANILAAECGQLVYWRTAPDGVKWFRRQAINTESPAPLIQGVESDDDTEVDDDGVELVDDDAGFDPQPGLDDFERAQLQQWADELRQRGRDTEGDEDAHAE